jgi:outer membrane murein-binding lipoprotein Lpp
VPVPASPLSATIRSSEDHLSLDKLHEVERDVERSVQCASILENITRQLSVNCAHLERQIEAMNHTIKEAQTEKADAEKALESAQQDIRESVNTIAFAIRELSGKISRLREENTLLKALAARHRHENDGKALVEASTARLSRDVSVPVKSSSRYIVLFPDATKTH